MFLIALAACHELPDEWSLQAEGIEVAVTRAPYAVSIRDAEGNPVLATTAADGAGYGGGAYAEGSTHWETVLSPGYYQMTPVLGEWQDDWVVVDAIEEATAVELILAPTDAIRGKHRVAGDESRRMHIRHEVRDSALRVEAWVDGASPRAWSVGFDTTADEAFMGFGERFTRTNLRGLSVYGWAEEGGIGVGESEPSGPTNPAPNGEPMTYYPVPFFISSEGYGFWLDTTWYNAFELTSERDDAWRAWHIGDVLAYEVYLPKPLDPRPWPYHLIDSFTEATGRPMTPTKAAFGPRRRSGAGVTVDGVLEAQKMRDEDLAITAIDDTTHFLPRGSHVGNEDGKAAWVETATDLGLRACGYYNPYIEDSADNPLQAELEAGKEGGWFLHDAAGEPSDVWLISGELVTVLTFDFTDPAATSAWQDMIRWGTDLGYSCYMFDFGEYVQPEVVTDDGRTAEEYHNAFPVEYHRAMHEALDAQMPDEWFTYTRSGYTGDSQYSPVVWGGDPAASFEDSDGLPSMVRAGINLGISGAPHFGGDINGFHCLADGGDAADGELLTRWIQQGSMGSDMHDQNACSGDVSGVAKATIWTSPDAKEAWRTYARLHSRMLPYWMTLASEATATGAPVIRHTFLEHPDRVDLASVDDAYYVGPTLYVAPVVERGAVTKTVSLPEGLYLDWTDQQLIEGGAEVTLEAPLSKLPLLLRDGYLLPLLDPTLDTVIEEDNPEVVGYGDVADVYDVVGLISTERGAATAVLFDDTALQVNWAGGFTPPAGFTEADDEAELSTCTACYRTDALDGVTRVRLSMGPGEVAGGGLTLSAIGDRRIRWDVYLVE